MTGWWRLEARVPRRQGRRVDRSGVVVVLVVLGVELLLLLLVMVLLLKVKLLLLLLLLLFVQGRRTEAGGGVRG